ncbi:HotDog domain-containing protein [Pyrenochaeta sp. MPI-SDFR-AT-0127]|nr:HotDog domain-containing protein [Pyrenochaeta sp. MPI-SDFR-AT-0127]
MTTIQLEHIEDFTAHEWCNKLLSDPSIVHIAKRNVQERREGVSNTFFTRTLFTDGAIRGFLSLHRPGKGTVRDADDDAVFVGDAPIHDRFSSINAKEEQRQNAKVEIHYDVNDPDTSEAMILVSIGHDVDGGTRRLHGGVTAALLDQVMGTLISYVYQHLCATSELTIQYKKAISTPCVLLCRTKLVREKGRWIETKGWIEDGHGTVFAEGLGSFVMSKLSTSKI